MGRLRPGAEFDYRKIEDMTVAFDKETGERIIVGYDYSQDYQTVRDSMQDSKFWGDLRREAKTNVALQKALNRAILIYQLSKNGDIHK